jgi:hypothetical protein
VCTLPLIHSGRIRTPWLPTAWPGSYNHRGDSVTEAALWSVRSGWIFLDFRRFPSSLLPPRGRPYRCCKPYDTALDRFAPVSPDRILGLNATPVPQSGTVLPNLSSGSRDSSHPCERVFRLSAGRLSSTSRFPSTSLQPRGISAPPRPGDEFGFITCRLLRSANYPCRLRATAHPDRLPSSIRNPGLLNRFRVGCQRFNVLRLAPPVFWLGL